MQRLIHAKPRVEDQSKYLMEIANGFERGQIFLTAFELDLFTRLQKSQTAMALSVVLGAYPDLTMSFPQILAAFGVVAKEGDNYRIAPDILQFVVGHSRYAGSYLNPNYGLMMYFLNKSTSEFSNRKAFQRSV